MTNTLFLRRALLADAVVSGGAGLLMLLGAGLLDGLLGLPAGLLRYAGASLLPFAAIVGTLGTRLSPALPAVWAVVAYNALWALDSVLLLVSGWVAPTVLGYGFVPAQAGAVALFAGMQWAGSRRAAVREA
jgi:hypothetical protein